MRILETSRIALRLRPATFYLEIADLFSAKGEPSMKYLVSGSDGPGFATPEEALELLENVVIPSLDALNKLQSEKKILAGGLKVGDRAFVFVAEAESNEKLDRMLREIPFWGMVRWEVTPLEGFDTRATEERAMTARLKKVTK
jgi:hypothetical protein